VAIAETDRCRVSLEMLEWHSPNRERTPPVTIRVVIAEDEAIIRLDLKESLEEEGYEVVGEASRGDQAEALVRELRPDLAILDIKMPGVDGLTAARAIAADRLCAVLMLTAFSQREIIEEARDAGALAYLVKPFQKTDLIPALEVAIGRFRELQQLGGEVDSLAEQLESRKVVDRAKGLLIDECDMREADAFTFIQRTAMSERSRMREVAERILDGSLRP
jgi:response regulator NasT